MNRFIILASGQSITQKDIDYCKDKGTVIAINNTYKLASWAQMLWACDANWWRFYPEALDFKGEKYSLEFDHKKVKKLKSKYADGLGLDLIHCGGNSGYQCINFAYLQGATEIILLGFDMHGEHWHGKHKTGLSNIHDFDKWINNFQQLAIDLKDRNIKVINCTPNTKLNCFKKLPLKKVI